MVPEDESAPFGLGQLPDELLLEIIDHLKPIRGFKASIVDEKAKQAENASRVQSLHALTLLCRRMYLVANPLLYQTFIQPSLRAEKTAMFLKTIVNHRPLADNIQYIESRMDHATLVSRRYGTIAATSWNTIVREMESASWQARIKDDETLWLHFKRLLDTSNSSSWFHAELSLIIALSPHLIDVALTEPTKLLAATLALKKHMNTGGLRNLWIKVTPNKWWTKPERVLKEAILPACIPISSRLWLSGANTRDVPFYDLPVTWYSHTAAPNVEELDIDMCEIEPRLLEQMIMCRNHLKRFTCRWGIQTESPAGDVAPQAISLPRLGAALSKHASTLEHLVLDTLESGWMVSMDQDIPAIGSLRQFTTLKSVQASALVLWGEDEDLNIEQLSLASIFPNHWNTSQSGLSGTMTPKTPCANYQRIVRRCYPSSEPLTAHGGQHQASFQNG